MKIKNDLGNYNNISISQKVKDEMKMNVDIEKLQESSLKIINFGCNRLNIKRQSKKIERLQKEKLIVKIFLIIIIFFYIGFIFLTKEIKIKNKIITIGFYDVIHCDRQWRRVKKGYFYDLPKYINKFRWVFLAKNELDSNCNNFTHVKFRKVNDYKTLEKVVVRNKIDIIIQNEDESIEEQKHLLALKKRYGTKLVQIMHEYYFFLLFGGVIYTYNNNWKPLKNFDAVISSVPSQIFLYHLQQLNQSIYLPQILPFEYKDISPSKLETKNILMIGRISQEKQYELGIKAMPYIVKEFPDAILNIIGGFNEYAESLKQLAQDLNISNNVIFYNSQQDLRTFYSNASIYFMTSISESFSFVLAEAKAYGLANIVTGKEYLVLAKKGSIIVKDNDYKEMANYAIKLFSNKTYLKEQGKAARESLDDFLTEKVELRYINLYESLMNGTSKIFLDKEYIKYINETESLKELKNSLEFAKKLKYNKFHCLKFEEFLKPFQNINISYCNKKMI
jgi:glycosyltransferase involved in cell wall biosynthesis